MAASDELNYVDQQHLLLISSSPSQTSSPLLSSISFNYPPQDQEDRGQLKQHQQLLNVNGYADVSQGGSCDFHQFLPPPSLPSLEINNSTGHADCHGLKLSIFHDQGEDSKDIVSCTQSNDGLVDDQYWMPPKMRIMKKISFKPTRTTQRFQDQQQQPISLPFNTHNHRIKYYGTSSTNNNNNNNTTRVCADCYTTKTPLWRSGPRGPKSLCNACGIRQRKARRAMMAAAAARSTLDLETDPSSMRSEVQFKEKKLMVNKAYVEQYKKVCKLSCASTKDICLDHHDQEISMNLSKKKKSSDFHGVFPQDEKEAAILLMALSCGSC